MLMLACMIGLEFLWNFSDNNLIPRDQTSNAIFFQIHHSPATFPFLKDAVDQPAEVGDGRQAVGRKGATPGAIARGAVEVGGTEGAAARTT